MRRSKAVSALSWSRRLAGAERLQRRRRVGQHGPNGSSTDVKAMAVGKAETGDMFKLADQA